MQAASPAVVEGEKHCPICDEDLPLNDFGLSRASADGHNLYCKSCIRKKTKDSRDALREYRARRKSAHVITNAQARARHIDKRPNDAKPEHFMQPWPTVRTDTFVEMVFGSIKQRGRCTQQEILDDTKLEPDTVGMALADLVLWQRNVRTAVDEREETRFYFVKE